MPNRPTRSRWVRNIGAIAIVLAGAIVRHAFLGKLGTHAPYLTFYPAVMLAALYGGLSGGIWATLLSAALVNYFWTEPVGSFEIASSVDLLGMAIFMTSCMMISTIIEVMHRAQSRAIDAEAKRNRLTDELLQKEKLFRALFEQASDGIFFFDTAGKIISVNESFARLHGYTVEEMLQLGLEGLDVEGTAHVPERLSRIMADESLTFEVKHYHRDGHIIPLEVRANLVSVGDEQLIITIHRDITERKRAEEQLAKLNEELEQRVNNRTLLLQRKTEELEQANERLKEVDRLKSTFIASMSHELRTPLNVIIGFSSILHDEWLGPVNAEQKRNLASILSSGRHLLSMITDVLDVTQMEAGTVTPVIEEFDLYDLLTEAESVVTAAMRQKGLELRSELLRQRMRTDRRRLLQCVLNILSNAAKFTDKGEVAVEVRDVSFSAETPEEKMVEIAVTDTGIGIGEEDLPRIFLPFHRIVTPGRTIVPGTGIGLYLTRKIATDILKGDILVSSEYGKGSRFSLIIPASLDEKGICGDGQGLHEG